MFDYSLDQGYWLDHLPVILVQRVASSHILKDMMLGHFPADSWTHKKENTIIDNQKLSKVSN